MNKILLYARLLIALSIAVLSVLAIFGLFYPLKIFDVQFTALLQRVLISPTTLSIVLFTCLLILTLVFGRIYCSTLCPLGIFQELLTILFKPFYKKRKHKQESTKKFLSSYFLAVILFGLCFGGTVILLRLLDPYSVFGNALSGNFYGISFLSAITVLVFFKKRLFCTHICPVGTILGLLSRFSLFKIRIDENKCKICGICANVCPTDSIDFKNNHINNETCIKCLKCLSHCNHSAIYYGLAKKKEPVFNPSRRQFLINSAVLTAFGLAWCSGIKLSKYIGSKIKKVIVPAGSGSPESLVNHCLNCNLCVKNCPMKIIKKANKEYPAIHIEYGARYCNFNCHKCSKICPSGAIKPISLKEKQKTQIGIAKVNTDKCIKCGLCSRECPKKIIKFKSGSYPQISADECIGCGKCQSMCPMQAIHIEPVETQRVLTK